MFFRNALSCIKNRLAVMGLRGWQPWAMTTKLDNCVSVCVCMCVCGVKGVWESERVRKRVVVVTGDWRRCGGQRVARESPYLASVELQ